MRKAIEHDKADAVYRYQAQQSRFGQMKCRDGVEQKQKFGH
jgi:hypothetical protein